MVRRGGAKAPRGTGRGQQLGERLRGISTTSLTRAGHLGLWALLGLTFLAAAVALLRPPPRATAAVKVPEPTVGAQGFAELYVAAYLSAGKGSEESLRAFYPVAVDLGDVAPGGLYAGRTTAIEAREVQHRYWAVTVGAEILYPQGGGMVSAGVRFYQVGVARVGEAYVATSLPAEVPTPAPGRGPKLAVPSMDRPGRDDPVAAAVARFASAFLGADGELARYTAPGSTLRAVRPAPFRSVEVTGLADRDIERDVGGAPAKAKEVLAEVKGTDANGRAQVMNYSLELVQRAGRWEVTKLLAGPPLAAEQPPATRPGEPPTTASSLPASPTTSVVGVATTTTASTTTTTTVSGRPAASPERTTTTR